MDDGIRMTIITLNQYMYKTTTYNLGYLPKASSAAFAMGGKAKEYTSFVNVCYYPPRNLTFFIYTSSVVRFLLVFTVRLMGGAFLRSYLPRQP